MQRTPVNRGKSCLKAWSAIRLKEPVGDSTFQKMWSHFFQNRPGTPLEAICSEFIPFCKRVNVQIPLEFHTAVQSVIPEWQIPRVIGVTQGSATETSLRKENLSPNFSPARKSKATCNGLGWLSIRQIVENMDVGERTVRSWIYGPVDPLPAYKVGGKVFVRKAELDSYLARHKIEPLESIDVDAIVGGVLGGHK